MFGVIDGLVALTYGTGERKRKKLGRGGSIMMENRCGAEKRSSLVVSVCSLDSTSIDEIRIIKGAPPTTLLTRPSTIIRIVTNIYTLPPTPNRNPIHL